ncbi:MAG TPA: hypothetical protein VJ783_15320 [Pirellulales bacterium]|nr:hypothetical protein [Pirellulales bacterium]
MVKPAVSVGLRKGRLFVIPQLSPGAGTYIDKEPVREAPEDDAERLGQTILEAFGDFSEVDVMPNLLAFRSPIIAAAEVRSYGEYERGLKDCLVVIEDDQLHIMCAGPHKYIPRDTGALHIGNAVLTALHASPYRKK